MNITKLLKKLKTNKILLFASPFVIYLVVAFILWGPDHLTEIHRYFFTPAGDPQAFVWYLRWWPFSIVHGINPFVEKYLFYPSGYNLAWSTSISTLAIIMAPFTAIWGAVTSFNILALVSLPFSALCCYWLVYAICKKYWASLLSGFIYGFSTFQVAQLLGHPCFYVSFVPPLVVLVVMIRFRERIKKLTFILIVGLLLAMQFGISTEAFGSMIVFGVITWLLVLIFGGKKLKPKLYKTTFELILAGVIAMIILSPFMYYLIKGYSGVPKFIYPPVGYSTDLLNFIMPTKITLIGGKTFLHISSKFTANTAEQGAYLTIPLVLFIFTFCLFYWRKWYVKVLAVLATLIAVLSMGPRLNINGIRYSTPLPEAIFTRLPLLRSMLPMRFDQYLFLVAAVMLGFWFSFGPKKLSTMKVKIVSILKYALVLLVIILMLPAASNYSWQKVTIPKFFTPNVVNKYIGVKQNVLFLPYMIGYDPEFWQEASGMKFKTANGYLGFPPVSVTNNTTAYDLYREVPEPNFANNFISFCQTHGVSEIIYAPYAKTLGAVEINEVQSLNWPSYSVDQFVIIKVPRAYQ